MTAIEDDPELDGTDFAHPAWWRGEVAATDAAATILEKAIDGHDNGGGVCAHAGLERIRRWILQRNCKP